MRGGCTCGEVRYTLLKPPLFIHACHCTWCQRETGSAFVLNGIIEAHQVALECGTAQIIPTPSESGAGQNIARCPTCRVALWSTYSGAGERFLFMRLGTLDDTSSITPDIHIFTESKQAWLDLDGRIPVMPQYYKRSAHWPEDSLARRAETLALPASDAAGPRPA